MKLPERVLFAQWEIQQHEKTTIKLECCICKRTKIEGCKEFSSDTLSSVLMLKN